MARGVGRAGERSGAVWHPAGVHQKLVSRGHRGQGAAGRRHGGIDAQVAFCEPNQVAEPRFAAYAEDEGGTRGAARCEHAQDVGHVVRTGETVGDDHQVAVDGCCRKRFDAPVVIAPGQAAPCGLRMVLAVGTPERGAAVAEGEHAFGRGQGVEQRGVEGPGISGGRVNRRKRKARRLGGEIGVARCHPPMMRSGGHVERLGHRNNFLALRDAAGVREVGLNDVGITIDK